MGKREYYLQIRCAHKGCLEWGVNYRYPNLALYIEARKKYRNRDNYCLRHRDSSKVLIPENPTIRFENVYVNEIADPVRYPASHRKGERFWNNSIGFINGDGWMAWSEDWPEGTVVRVEVHVTATVPEVQGE